MIDAEMYGMMPREDREPAKSAAGKEIEESEDAALQGLEELLKRDRIDAGRRNVRAEAIHGEKTERVHDALAQVLDCPDVANGIDEAHPWISWQDPPASSMCFFAEAENFVACTVSFFVSFPSPRILIPAF